MFSKNLLFCVHGPTQSKGPTLWGKGEECVKHPRKHELLFSHKYEKAGATTVESFWRNQPVGWLLYSWDLDKGSGQGVVKAVVLEVKDLSRSWMSFRAADKSKNCIQALQEPLDHCWYFILNRHLLGILLFVGQIIIRKKKKKTGSRTAFKKIWGGAESWNRREDQWRGPRRPLLETQMTTTHRCLCNSSYINTHGWKEFPNTKTEQTSISLPFFPDLIIAAPIIAVIFIIALSIYRVCFHHSNKVTLVFPCKERQRKRGREKRERERDHREESAGEKGFCFLDPDLKLRRPQQQECCTSPAPSLCLDFPHLVKPLIPHLGPVTVPKPRSFRPLQGFLQPLFPYFLLPPSQSTPTLPPTPLPRGTHSLLSLSAHTMLLLVFGYIFNTHMWGLVKVPGEWKQKQACPPSWTFRAGLL